MSGERTVGQDVRFNSSLCWAWWPNKKNKVECIDGSTGFLVSISQSPQTQTQTQKDNSNTNTDSEPHKTHSISEISSASLMELYHTILSLCTQNNITFTTNSTITAAPSIAIATSSQSPCSQLSTIPTTLSEIRSWKRSTSPEYEAVKDHFLTQHRVFGQWYRRKSHISISKP